MCSNYALQLDVAMPLYMVLSAATLCVNMAMGRWLLRRQYGALKYVAVAMITVGVGVFTVSSSSSAAAASPLVGKADRPAASEGGGGGSMVWWSLGVLLMGVSLVMSARVSIYQEVIYRRYGKHARDALFISVSFECNYGFQ